jgi:hypothetical protein
MIHRVIRSCQKSHKQGSVIKRCTGGEEEMLRALAGSSRNNKQGNRQGDKEKQVLRKSEKRTETYHGSFWLIERNHMTEKRKDQYHTENKK